MQIDVVDDGSIHARARQCVVEGALFHTCVLPHARLIAVFQPATAMGKLKAAITKAKSLPQFVDVFDGSFRILTKTEFN